MAKHRARNSKGRFVKGGHSRSSGGTTAIVVAPARAPARRRSHSKPVKKTGRRRRNYGGGSSGVTMGKVIGAGVGLALLTSDTGLMKETGKSIRDALDKVPGSKTFGRVAVAGLGLGALGKWVVKGGRARPWLLAAGVVGLAVAAVKLGDQNSEFKWLGDDDDLMDVNPGNYQPGY